MMKSKLWNQLFHFTHLFIRDHITIYNRYYLLSLHSIYVKTKKILTPYQYKNGEKYWIKKKVVIKNRTCNYFDDITKIEDFDFNNILLDEKSYGNTLIYNVSNKTSIVVKPLGMMSARVDGFIKDYNGTKYLALFGSGKI